MYQSILGLILIACCIFSSPIHATAARKEKLDSISKRATTTSSSVYQTRFENVTWDNDQWLLTTTNLDPGHYQSRMIVANGYHGINVAALGPFFEIDSSPDTNGWPLFDARQSFATVGGFWDSQPMTPETNFPWLYQYGWDSVISGIPHWSGIVVDLGGSYILDASTDVSSISNFSSTLDMKQGLMNWAFTWTTPSRGTFDIMYQMFAHKVQLNQGFVRLAITPRDSVNLTIANVLNGDCALRTNATSKGVDGDLIYSAVSPYGVANVSAYVYAGMSASNAQILSNHSIWTARYVGGNESSIASAMYASISAGQTAYFDKFVGIASTDGFEYPQYIAKRASTSARQTGYVASMQTHTAEWAAVFTEDSVDRFTFPENGTLPNDTYVIEAAITAVTNPYQILQNTISLNATIATPNASINSHSIAVGGLGSDSYAGQIFWDADVWMHPGIAAAFPYASQGITNYRQKLYPQALANIETNYEGSKNDTTFSSNAAIYPWTSGRYGNCTATGPCWDYQYHLNGDIVFTLLKQWLASGNPYLHNGTLYNITESIATMYSEILQKNGSYWTFLNMTDPDEYANHVDNGGYTMPLVAETLRFANSLRTYFNQSQNDTWTSQAQNVLIGRDMDANIVLEYTGPTPQNGSIVIKQADVVLNSYPLGYFNENYTAADAVSDLNYYANKQSADGPGMTYAIFSIVASEVSPSGCSAYTYQQYSYQPYLRAPWFQFSEQMIDDPAENGGTHPAFPFLTGAGGANQVILYGYLGLRYINDDQLHVDPAPPPQLPNIRYRTFYWQGWPISASSNQTHTTLMRPSPRSYASGTVPQQAYANAPIRVVVGSSSDVTQQTSYMLPPNGTIVLPNRQYWQNKTISNNIAQCRSIISSNSDYIPGQFPISAIDGATSTRWQPKYANITSSITVEIPVGQQVAGFEFIWGLQPPYNYSVVFHNQSEIFSMALGTMVASDSNVTISQPYNATETLEVLPIVNNVTTVSFNGSTAYSGAPIYTARYATLSIWGNQFNSSFTAQNMSGDGATVAEWAIIVVGNLNQTASGARTRSGKGKRASTSVSGMFARLAADEARRRGRTQQRP